MTTIEIYDRPLCCSTGICGPQVDSALVRFAADLDWLKGQGVEACRYNLAFEPGAFTRHEDVIEALRVGQVACLPIVRVAGRIVSQGHYPGRDELAAWCGVADHPEPAPARCCAPGCC
jgi:arsenite methyltransferase